MEEGALNGLTVIGLIGGTELLGSERGNMEALRAMQSAGARIVAGISGREKGGGAVGKACRDFGFRTFELPYGSHFSKAWMRNDQKYRNRQIKRLFTNSVALHKAIRTFNPDVILCGNTLAYAFTALALTFHRTPVVFRVGDAPVVESRFQFWLWRRLMSRCSHVVAISQFMARCIEPWTPKGKTISVIRNVAPSRTGEPDQNVLEDLIQEKRPNQGVYVGQITSRKGVPLLADALLKADDPHLGCWIVGGSTHSKTLEDELKAKVKKSDSRTLIQFLGFQSDPRPHLRAADWHIAPSIYEEPMGNVVQEAKAQGTPSIVSSRGGLPETISPGRTGWILDELHPDALIRQFKTAAEAEGPLLEVDILHEHHYRFSKDVFQQDWQSVIHTVTK